jgi:eukaryotic-like serine/threonine-protein kinase
VHDSDTTVAHDGEHWADPLHFPAGRIFAGRYRIVSLLGRGGMGEVYRADDLKVGQTVALKLLASAATRDQRAVQQFVREVRLARGIAHVNVCRVYDIGEAEGWHYLSMEFVDGETLRSLLRRIGRLPREKAFDIATQLCAGLAAAHEQGVLHRDLKPTNIMIDGRGRVRIMDFGLAIPSDASVHEFAGTPGYMAPEQIVGARITERTDLYALGLIVYELFVGEKLFDVNAVGFAEREARWRSAQDALDPAIARLVARCLETDPTKRPSSAGSVAAALDPAAPTVDGADAGGLAPVVAWGALAAIIIGTLVLASHAQTFTVSASDLPNAPEVLAARARDVLTRSGVANATDREFWFAPPPGGAQSSIRFVYRQSPAYLIPKNLFHVVTEDDPPKDVPGMTTVTLDPRGRLVSFATLADPVIPAGGGTAPIDWAPWFADAGLNERDFVRVDGNRTPRVTHDARLFWQSASGLRVSAATLNGAAVLFEVGDPIDRGSPPRNVLITRRPFALEVLLWTLVVVTFVIGSVLARRNLRSGRGDRGSARKLALFIACGGAVFTILRAHHVPMPLEEVAFLLGIAGWVLVWTAFTWLVYIAFEPHVRRMWPDMLTSWTRFVSGRLRDPQVGRDVLAGCLTAISIVLMLRARADLLHLARPEILLAPALESLKSPRHLVADLAYQVTDSIQFAFGGVFLLLLLRLICRRTWIAAIFWIAVVTFANTTSIANAPGGLASVWDILVAIAIGVLTLNVVLRLGLLAAVATLELERLLIGLPLTLDASAWFAESSLAILVLVCAIAVYGFVVSLGDRPAFGV